MIRNLTLLIIICCLHSLSTAQCPSGDITFFTQAEIDAFPVNYPNCTDVLGSVNINGADITNLNGLSQITGIGDFLEISSNPMLNSLAGLANLSSIGTYLYIYYNPGLTSLTGLDNLTSVGEDVTVEYNDGLLNLVGLNSLTDVPLSLDVNHNAALTSLDGLQNINSIGGGLTIYDNAVLTDISALDNLTSIGEWLDISDNAQLAGLEGLDNLTNLGGWLFIANNSTLSDISSLSSLESINGSLEISNNSALTSLTGLDNIDHSTITDLYLQGSPSLSFCDVASICDYLAIPANPATISGNATGCANRIEVETACSSMLSCTNLTTPIDDAVNVPVTTSLTWAAVSGAMGYKLTIGTTPGGSDILNNFDVGNVTIYDPVGNLPPNATIYVMIVPYNAGGDAVGCGEESFMTGTNSCLPNGFYFSSQVQIDAFPANYPGCTEISGDVYIVGSGITNLTGLSQLTSIGGSLSIFNSTALTTLSGLDNLSSIEEELYINGNSALTTLSGLDNLSSIGGYLYIYSNSALTTLSGLDNLSAIGGYLYILSNSALTTLSGLETLSSIGGELSIVTNPALTTLLGLDNLSSIGGFLNIGDNSALTTLSGLENLSSIGGFLLINNNAALASLSGLENLSSVGGFLVINSNAALATLSGLENLSSVGGVLRIYDNAALATLSGLDNLNSIGGFLDINNNAALTNINGIQNINPNTINSTSSIFNDIEIHNNTLLSTCAVTSVCDAILAHSATTNIHSNAIGCNSQTEVEAACVVPLPCSNIAGPINGATNIPVTTSLIWTAASGATGYKLTIGVTPGGTDILNNVDLGNVTTYTPVSDFPFNTTIYVKITPYNGSGDATGCEEESFTTADQCPNGDLTLFTQGEVDSFLIRYPFCTELLGSICIGDCTYPHTNSNITNLNGLSQLTTIGGGMFIFNNPNLVGLTGLENLVSVAGVLSVSYNAGLVSFSGIGNLNSIGGDVYVSENTALASLNGLGTLSSIGGGLYISGNSALADLTDLTNLTSIGGYLSIGFNDALTSLSGLENIDPTTISNLIITNSSMLSLCGIQSICDYLVNPSNLATISDNATGCATRMEVETACAPAPDCTTLASPLNGAINVPVSSVITWAASATATGYKLTIGATPDGTDILDNLDLGNVTTYTPVNNFPFSATIYVKITPYNGSGDAVGCTEESFTTADQCPTGDVTLLTQAEVDAFVAAYPNCSIINGNLTIGSFGTNSNINDLSGLSLITSASSLYIFSNPLLTDLTGLNNLATLNATLQILGNDGLTNLTGLGSLSAVQEINIAFNNSLANLSGIGNITALPMSLQINFNPVLTSLSGMSSLTSIGLDLTLTYNNLLSDLTALNNVTSVGAHLNIGYCPALISLAGLENLITVNNELTIINNASLSSLLNLNSLATIGGNLEISNNPLLSSCEAQAICDYLASPSGTVIIENNAMGCITGAEVQLSCINDNCPNDPNKTEPGICGCGIPDDDTDMDGYYVCEDCDDNNPNINPGSSPQLSNVIYHNPNSVTVYWNTIPGSSNYAIRHRELDSNGAWAEGTSLRSYRRLYSLAACTSYEVQFRNFKNGVWNCWSESDYFTTSGCAKAYSPGATKGASMQGMQIFPNPASDILNVVFDENLLNKVVILTLRDQLGRTVWNRNIKNLETTLIELNLREYNLPGGVYMLSLQNDGSIITQQVVVSR